MERPSPPQGSGAILTDVLERLGHQMLGLAPGVIDPVVRVREPVLWDPLDPLPAVPGGVLLLVGCTTLHPRLDVALADAGRLHYTAAVIKRRGEGIASTIKAANRAGLCLLVTSDDAAWGTLESLISAAIAADSTLSNDGAAALTEGGPGDLFALANAIAVMADGAITIEDVDRRVLAYSNIEGQPIDDVRRDSILGRVVPSVPEYDSEYQSLARSERAIQFPREETTFARVAMPVRISGRFLGSIWAIDKSAAKGRKIARQLEAVAPTAALHMLTAANLGDVERRRRAEVLAAQLGASASRGGNLTLTLRDRLPVALLGFGPLSDSAGFMDEQRLTKIIALNAEALSPVAACARVGDAIYVLLPEARNLSAVRLERLAQESMRAAASTGSSNALIGCAFALNVKTTRAVPQARRDIDAALRAMKRRLEPGVMSIDGQRHLVVMQELVESGIGEDHRLVKPVRDLLDNDRARGTSYAVTLLAHLDHFGDVRKAAAQLGVHENSQRYRMRRVIEQFELDLDDPELRLVIWLQLRIVTGSAL